MTSFMEITTENDKCIIINLEHVVKISNEEFRGGGIKLTLNDDTELYAKNSYEEFRRKLIGQFL